MMEKGIDSGVMNMNDAAHNFAIDYSAMEMSEIDSTLETLKEQKNYFKENFIGFSVPATEILQDYSKRADQLQLVLWLLQIPVILMIIFYLFMVSQLNVEQEKNEIAVKKAHITRAPAPDPPPDRPHALRGSGVGTASREVYS